MNKTFNPKKSTDGFENFVAELAPGLLTCDREGNITSANDFLFNLLGSPSGNATKEINMLTFPLLIESGISAVLEEALATGNNTSIETSYRLEWGKELFVNFRAFPLKDEDGSIYGCHAIIEDFTNKRKDRTEIEKNRLKDRLISKISHRFINSNFKDIDENINKSLKDLANFIGTDHAVLFSADESRDLISKTYEWFADGHMSVIPLNMELDKKKLVSKQLNDLQIVNIPDVHEMSTDMENIQKTLQEIGVRSTTMVPLSYNGLFKGFIGIGFRTKRRNWEENDLYVLKIAGEMIASVLERKNTENLLLKKENEYENIIDLLDTIIWKATFDNEGNVTQTYISKPMDKMLGFPKATIGNDWGRYFAHIHPDDMEVVQNKLQFAFNNPATPVDVEYRVLSDDGKITWVNSFGSSHPIGDGIYQMIGTTSNINDRKIAEEGRKNAENTLKEHEALLSEVTKIGKIGGWEVDLLSEKSNWTPEVARIHDLDFDEVVGVEKAIDFYEPGSREIIEKAFNNAVQNAEPYDLELEMISAKGKHKWVRASGRPRMEKGKVVKIIGFFQDITERKLAEEKLRESEKRLADAQQIAHIGNWDWNIISNELYWSDETYRIFGHEPQEFECTYETFLRFIHPDDSEQVQDSLNRALYENKPYSIDHRIILPDRSERVVHEQAEVTFNEDGHPIRMVGTLQDITERKQIEEALHESERHVKRKLNAILNPEEDIGELELADIIDREALDPLVNIFYRLTDIPAGLLDLEGNILVATPWQDICINYHRAHPETCKYCVESNVLLSSGVEPGTYKAYKCKNNIWDVVTPVVLGDLHLGNMFIGQFFFDDEEVPYDTFRQQAKKYGFDEKEYMEALDSVPRWSNENIKLTMEFYTRLIDVFSSLSYSNIKLARTLKERDDLLISLRENEEKLRLFIEHAPASLVMLDRDMRHMAVSQRWLDELSLRKEDIIGQSHYDLFPETFNEFNEVHQRAMKGEVISNDDYLFKKADGNVRRTRWEMRPWEAADGTIGGIIIFSEDITERKKTEEAMLAAKMEAETASRTKSEFLANMSHELRTPLNSIIGFSEMILNGLAGDLEPKQEHYAQHISNSGHHLLNIINDILDISKIEAGKMELRCEMLDIRIPIDEIVNLTHTLVVKKNITVNVNAPDDLPGIMADKSKIKQVLYNLVGNAIKFTNSSDEIKIHAELRDGDVRISVIDTGIGISPEDQDKLFKPFSQIDSSMSRKYEGTGLGLALVKEIIELHQGRIWVESETGKGSSFIFELPITR